MEAYCVKCRAKREMQNPQPLFSAKGAAFTRGACPVCGTTLTRFGETEAHKAVDRAALMAQAEAKSQAPKPKAQAPNSKSRAPNLKTQNERRSQQGTGAAHTPTRRTPNAPRGPGWGPGSGAHAQSVSDGSALVIVESPAKAKTVGRFLGRDYRVRASIGHIRDLPLRQMGVDLEHNFKPHYVITPKKKEVVKELKELARHAREIYLATDPDREGEAISWHLAQTLHKDIAGKPVHRVEFHEITREAVDRAFAHPRGIDMDRVNAQQARRVLDRIVGYTISPLLRKKMTRKGLSAGRVQSVAVRLVVEREREIQNFVPVEYWSIEAELAKQEGGTGRQGDGETGKLEGAAKGSGEQGAEGSNSQFAIPNSQADGRETFRARLIKVGDQDFECHTGEEALQLKATLERCDYRVLDVRRKDVARNPAPPFITSTLQQEASRKLGFNAKRTMSVAQQLYEGLPVGEDGASSRGKTDPPNVERRRDDASEGNVGLITYMRTDSTNIAESAQKEAWAYIKEKFGESYLPKTPRFYTKKVAGAQEAHEAIRPTRTFREPQAIKPYLNGDQFKLYDLIWKRFVASQMASAIFDTTAVDIAARQTEDGRRTTDDSRATSVLRLPSSVPDFLFRANGSILKFPGFLKVYGRSAGDEDEADDSDRRLPPLQKDEPLDLIQIIPEQHFTEPPPRYTEATLIKALEQFGIGRPSTYAPILSNIQERGYIEQIENRRLKPTELGFTVNDLLVAHFPDIVDVGFTAKMEEKLDEIAEGKEEWTQVLRDFNAPFQETLQRAATEMPSIKLEDEKTDIVCELCGAPMVIKRGRFGKFLACSTFPKCKNTKSLTTGVKCPECKQGELAEKRSKRGRTFYGCSRYPNCKFATWERPLPEPCPSCGGLLVANAKGAVHCIKCSYKRAAEKAANSQPVAVSG
jgi:DNA topoisomerase I